MTSGREGRPVVQRVGRGILRAAPLLMKFLSVAGTVAMFLVGGSIVAHGIPVIHHLVDAIEARFGALGWIVPLLDDLVVGLLVGALLLVVVTLGKSIVARMRGR